MKAESSALRLGIIGCGRVVEQFHLPAWRALQEMVRVTALADPVAQRVEVVGQAAGVPLQAWYQDYRQMLESETVDLVVVAVPHCYHEEIVLDCVRAGRHVIVEKPLAVDLESADRMVAEAERAGVRLGVLHNYCYRPQVREALRLIQAGAIGTPFFVRLESLGSGHFAGADGFDPDWRTRASVSGGGCVIDNAYHSFYLAEAMHGCPAVTVYARMGTYTQRQDVEDLGIITLSHASGGITSIQTAWSVKGGGQLVEEVHGTEGSIAFWRGGHAISLYRADQGEWRPLQVDATTDALGFVGAFRDYLTALIEGREMPVSGREARHILALIVAAYESNRRERAVKVGRGSTRSR